MTPLYLRIASEFKAGNEITTKKIRSIYASSNSHTKITIDFLLRAKAIKKTERKEGAFSIYVIQQDAYEKTVELDNKSKRYRAKTNRHVKCDVKELMKTHNPLILKFNALLGRGLDSEKQNARNQSM
ncbi:hypothetical protein ACUBYX_001857 [Providencia rettgeri]|uniref:hypothetical protein n=1 Tax=Providencia TaxID=586 RepID=UPI00226F171D|nr:MULTISPECIES: hypothetical protein [Providencia]MCX9094546.1 hypothetical protein [Providencia rettgeri]HEM6844233.1 hypothetical protein [Providencia rettgeri]